MAYPAIEQSEIDDEGTSEGESRQLQDFETRAIESDAGEYDEVEVHGNPEEMAAYYHEQRDNASCALEAQESALEGAGYTYDIENAKKVGEQEGWYTPDGQGRDSGTRFSDIGRDWERRGVDSEQTKIPGARGAVGEELRTYQTSAFTDLESDLDQGKAVVVGLDTTWLRQWQNNGGHAVWVTGTEHTSEGSSVICNDSGKVEGAGRGIAYDMEDFDRAWRSRDYFKVTTTDPILRR